MKHPGSDTDIQSDEGVMQGRPESVFWGATKNWKFTVATSPTSTSAPLSGAAKDDAIGGDGIFHYSYSEMLAKLLANDPGGANKLADHFFFGDAELAAKAKAEGAVGGVPSIDDQVDYLADLGITANVVAGKIVSFDITADAEDFNYMVQIGNKGTWSQGDVDVTAPVDTHHNGALAAEWTFENHTQANGDEVGVPTGFWNLNDWVNTYEAAHPGFTFGEDAGTGFAGAMQVHGVDGARALDTAASPGNIFLQAIPEGRGGDAATMPDLVAGQKYHAEVSILKQDYSNDPAAVAAGHAGTDPDAWVAFQFNNEVLNVRASDIHVGNEFVTFDVMFDGVEGEDGFSIMSHGTNDAAQGLLIDSIQIHEWVI